MVVELELYLPTVNQDMTIQEFFVTVHALQDSRELLWIVIKLAQPVQAGKIKDSSVDWLSMVVEEVILGNLETVSTITE